MANFIRTRGDTWTLGPFTVNPATDGTSWIISQFSKIYFTIRRGLPASTIADDTDSAVVLFVEYDVDLDTTSDGASVAVVDDTHFTITIDAETTQELANGTFPYDVQVTRTMVSPAQAFTTDSGKFIIYADVTRTPATPASP